MSKNTISTQLDVQLSHLGRDREGIVSLWSRTLPTACPERFEWLYSEGPSRAWVLRDSQGQIVGSSGLMARTVRMSSAWIPCGQAIDLCVDESHRTLGPALSLQRALTASMLQNRLAAIYAVPSPDAVPVLKRIGYRPLGTMDRWAKPLRTARRLQPKVKSKHLASIAGACVDRWFQWTSRERTSRLPRGYTTQLLTRFDTRFDELSEVASRSVEVIGDRGSDYLTWRFTKSPEKQFETFGLFDPHDRLVGYIIFFIEHGFVYVADLLFADLDTLGGLIGAFLKFARKRRAETVSVVLFAPPSVTDILREFGFYRRTHARTVFLLPPPSATPEQLQALFTPDRWFLTKADNDTDA